MLRKCEIIKVEESEMTGRMLIVGAFFFLSGLASAPSIATAQATDGGYWADDSCYYVPMNGQYVRKGCQYTDGANIYFSDELSGGTVFVLINGPQGAVWVNQAEQAQRLTELLATLAQLQAQANAQAQQGQQSAQLERDIANMRMMVDNALAAAAATAVAPMCLNSPFGCN